MNRELDPTHAEVRRKAIERIREHIARAVFGAAERLEPRNDSKDKEEI